MTVPIFVLEERESDVYRGDSLHLSSTKRRKQQSDRPKKKKRLMCKFSENSPLYGQPGKENSTNIRIIKDAEEP